jgi:hypothetical protein
MFENFSERDCYRRGVHDALENGMVHQSGAHLRALQQWVFDLEQWSAGEPPPGPNRWPAAERPQ